MRPKGSLPFGRILLMCAVRFDGSGGKLRRTRTRCRIDVSCELAAGAVGLPQLSEHLVGARVEVLGDEILDAPGLRRRGFSAETIQNIHEAYRIIYQGNLTRADAIQQIKEVLPQSPEIQYIIDFVENSQRGIIK